MLASLEKEIIEKNEYTVAKFFKDKIGLLLTSISLLAAFLVYESKALSWWVSSVECRYWNIDERFIKEDSIAFWIDTGGSTSIPYAISNLIQYARYPITIYPLVMQIILCFVVPCAFMGMIPAMIITGKVSVIYAVAVILIAALFMGLAVLVFNKGITKYESAGM